jgi:AcrR family transcriptional regulator
MVASEAGLAYGTFYRHFSDLAHVVRDAMVRETANLEKLNERFAEPIDDAATERAKLVAWVREAIAAVLLRPGLFRAWHVTSNHDWAVVAERQRRFEANVEQMARYLERLQAAGAAKSTPAFAAYAIIALVGAATREAAIDNAFSEAKHEGIISVVTDLAGL